MLTSGREILSRENIDERSERLLTYFKPHYFGQPKPTSLRELTAFLHRQHHIEFNFEQSLGYNAEGVRVLGACSPGKKLVVIDQAIQAHETKFNFTLAHELGHLALHRKVILSPQPDEQEIRDTAVHMSTGKRILTSERDWLEWQANAYAASLLMPEPFMIQVMMAAKISLGINLSRRTIFVDSQPVNGKDYFGTITEMAKYFQVSWSAMEYRLRELGLIEDHRQHPASIGDILIELL